MGWVRPPATVPNKAAGMLNQLLALKALIPPAAVIRKDGYMAALVMARSASAIFKDNSADRMSGRLTNIADGMPAASSGGKIISLSLAFLLMAAGDTAVKTLKAFSCTITFCCNKGINCAATKRCAVAC